VGEQPVSFAGVAVSSPDRALWPGISKRDLVRYYGRVADVMLPHLRGRPLTLRRFPRGLGAPGFVQQHWKEGLHEAVRPAPLREASGEFEVHMFVEDLAGLVALAQVAALELHGWGSRVEALERPDRLVFDLDPDEALPFAETARAARDIRDRLASVGIESWPMLSGGKGVHVVAALAPGPDWDALSGFAKRFAEALEAERPERYVATMAKADRSGRIFVDWLRNERGATAVMPFSPRSKPGAPVAMPLGWTVLEDCSGAGDFTLKRVLDEGVGMPDGWCAEGQELP
jgi:bifunctional non-homologous end joining protein LigD